MKPVPTPPSPNPDLLRLDALVGTWDVTGDATGESRYEWAPGRFFLIQHFDLRRGDHPVRGVEMIGHLQALGSEPSPDIHTRVYSYTDGLTLDYVYELDQGLLTIWGGHRGSSAFYRGEFSADGNTVTGGWQWPGGGYTANMTRVAPAREAHA